MPTPRGFGADFDRLQHAAQRALEPAPAAEALRIAIGHQRHVAHRWKTLQPQLHAHLGQGQAVAGPAGVGIQRQRQFRQDGPQLGAADVEDHQPRTSHQRPQRQRQAVERQEQRPYQPAESQRRGIGNEELHRSDDQQSHQGYAERRQFARAVDQQRTAARNWSGPTAPGTGPAVQTPRNKKSCASGIFAYTACLCAATAAPLPDALQRTSAGSCQPPTTPGRPLRPPDSTSQPLADHPADFGQRQSRALVGRIAGGVPGGVIEVDDVAGGDLGRYRAAANGRRESRGPFCGMNSRTPSRRAVSQIALTSGLRVAPATLFRS